MEFAARYQDGLVADIRNVLCVIDLAADPVALVILDAQSREVIDRWPATEVYLLHSRMMELRIANRQKPPGARLAVNGINDMRSALNVLPQLHARQRSDGWAQFRILVLATAALASVIVAYLYGIPLLADRLVAFVPPAWEIKIGDTAALQIERSMTGGKGYVDLRPRSQLRRQHGHRPFRRCRLRRPRLAVQARRSPSSAPTSRTLSRCPAAAPIICRRSSRRAAAPTSSPASSRTSSATSITATACRR